MKDFEYSEGQILPDLGGEIMKELNARGIGKLHLWWGRLPLTLARAAVYLALVPEQASDQTFLNELCVFPPDPKTVSVARRRITEAHIRRERMGVENEVVLSTDQPATPKVLDMFSGSGMIPLEVSNLGAETYALDLNPVAYVVQRCTLEYPQKFGQPSDAHKGSSCNQTWMGLAEEVDQWSHWVQEGVATELADLFPPVKAVESSEGTDDRVPLYYLWTQKVKCAGCGISVPIISDPWLVKKRGRSVALKWAPDIGEYIVVEANGDQALGFAPQANIQRGVFSCPVCDTQMPPDIVSEKIESSLDVPHLLCIVCQGSESYLSYIDGHRVSGQIPDAFALRARTNEVCRICSVNPLDEPIRLVSGGSAGFSVKRYEDLYTSRQILVMMTYIKQIHAAYGEMHRRRMVHEHAEAVTAYLGLLLNHIADNDRANRWDSKRQGPRKWHWATRLPSYDFVETNVMARKPIAMVHTKQVVEAIEFSQDIGRPARVFCQSATGLPFEDESFDAIVTDPPYYDNIAYADLSDFYYVWLKRSIGHLYPVVFENILTDREQEIIVDPSTRGIDRTSAYDRYEQLMHTALQEAARVLKSGCLLTIVVSSFKASSLDLFLNLAQKIGLELFDAKRIPEDRIAVKETAPRRFRLLLMFRKNALVRELPQAVANAETVIQRARKDARSLYNGLVELLMESVDSEDLKDFIPKQYRGNLDQRLSEYIADIPDPRRLLEDLLGWSGIRHIAKGLGLKHSLSREQLLDRILATLGFNIPEPPSQGVVSAIEQIRTCQKDYRLGDDIEKLLGAFITSVTLVESLLWQSVQAWAYAIFEDEYERHLLALLQGKRLDHLAFGDVKMALMKLPKYVAESQASERVWKEFRLRYIYDPRKQEKSLSSLITLRNKIAHNKEQYLHTTPVHIIQQELSEALDLMCETLSQLRERDILLPVVRPIAETQDMYGRMSMDLQMEDGQKMRIYIESPLELGRNYYLFPCGGNPHPVNPKLIPVYAVRVSHNVDSQEAV